ncbi:tyrosine-type recombinase/integrase [Geodermatophilus sp. URMC 61]|uniref:tyrosine-type recombinase/integrase n=1 Tax=Geodermatophilus sp. URMC 61 TaxID=3423411 RepID=UPI00406C2D8E
MRRLVQRSISSAPGKGVSRDRGWAGGRRKLDWRSWKGLLREADVREVRLHDGRHTAATRLLSEGVHPRVVMGVLGHAQMRTTTDTYSHVMPALGRDAADRMASALWD